MGGMASAAGDDIKIGFGLKDDPERGRPQYRGGDGLTDYQRRTKASVDRMNAPSQEDDKPAPRRSTMARAATVSSSGVAPVGAAPDLPDPDAEGETEKALLNANKKGQSAMIATSPAGLLAGDDSTRKKRSLMGGLIR